MTFQIAKGVSAVLTLVVALGACSASDGGDEGADEAFERVAGVDRVLLGPEAVADLQLTLETAQIRELVPSLEVPAEIIADPDRVAIIGSRVSGRIVDVMHNVGDVVAVGTPLAVLESVDVGSAVADYTAARARAEVAHSAAERASRLFEDRIVPERRVEESQADLRAAEAEEAAAATRLRTFGVPLPLPEGAELGRVTLSSPISGTMVARSASTGQWVEPSDQLAEVIDVRRLWLLASVYERDIRHVEVGQPVLVDVRAYPGEVFPGTVQLVEATLDESSRSAGIRVELPNPDRRLKPGMFATARITGTHAHEARLLLAIPIAAVQEVDGHTSVFVLDDEGGFTLQRVHLGEQAGDFVEVLNGLSEGDEVVVNGSFVLKGHLLRSTLGEDEH
ncbi:MAG: efflux RND transporter periplasmic adaptor subunit [Gemmatimonadetes bacterium]|nr:efflux RND transporter periplasmic adaptor subunit [Gemmatimonadota bacterium]